MKKVFPLIVVFITLSLLGIIYIQYNWIKNAAIMKQEQRKQHLIDATREISTELVNSQSPLSHFKIESHTTANDPSLNTLADKMNRDFMNRTLPVSVKFSSEEINAIIKKVLKAKDFETKYEYAIVSNYNLFSSFPVQSDNFLKSFEDTGHHLRCIIPLSNQMSMLNNEAFVMVIPVSKAIIFQSLGWMIAGSSLFTIIIITAFALTIFTMLRQKKLSEIKSDFINNMTHEFKTPISTISLAVDAIGNNKVMSDAAKIKYFTGIIKEENKRMNRQVETILQSALLEKDEIKLNLQPIDVHQVIHKIIDNLQLQLQKNNVKVNMELRAKNTTLLTDEVHFSNMISNLVDNAIKYAKENPEINITTSNSSHHSIIVSIADNGMGMSKETLSRIFEKFYRAHTGNLHNVKGFGLGLAYVKAIVDAHRGHIRVESSLGNGSRFEAEFPQQQS